MKRQKKKTFDYSPYALSKLVRKAPVPPSYSLKDKKKEFERKFCREREL
jgi:hypothetical protein